MKRNLFLVIMIVVLVSCVGLPKPKEDSDSLIIGYFELDFPDGFFDKTPRIIKNCIRLDFINLNTKKKFTVFTDNGYFRFLSNGKDDFLFLLFNYHQENGLRTYSLNEHQIKRKITNSPQKIIYTGHLTYTFAKPELLAKEEALGGGKLITHYRYRKSISGESNKKALIEYIQEKQPHNQWLDYEIEDKFEQ
jgi:hypothetical protein